MRIPKKATTSAFILALALVAAGCGGESSSQGSSSEDSVSEDSVSEDSVSEDSVSEESVSAEYVSEDSDSDESSSDDSDSNSDDDDDDDELGTGEEAELAAGEIHLDWTRDDVDCSAAGLGSADESDFTVAHFVVGGSLGAVCMGSEDATLIAAWEALSSITPPLQLADLALFGGFATPEGDEITLAFVNPVDDDSSAFQLSVNLAAYGDDENEALLTMAHEFSHVFNSVSTQLDVSAEAFESCDTYFNGAGCYLPDSLMFQWIEEFWGDGLISEIDPNAETTAADGQARCDADASFFGSYAASSPDEDFGEAFSAMVFRLEPDAPEQQVKMDWLANQPGLVEFQERAIAAGLGPLVNNFDLCGQGS